ncbi:hypothetical protein PGT21_010864 [Puccinia graminis f. sp. tritici]|uniref:Uncharacterized protein n=1 Tax=Puccinia graminis f. sp. tritici TaxID=56615 RepID=A0A5B0NBR2_PUCGR|nr:hypothetical protein PGT21_010864 [Puccinia graminis f. sp. tritici]
MHNSLPSADYNVNPKGRNIAELIEIFTSFHIFDKHGKFHTDLALLFQLIENQKEYCPHQFERFQENQNGFEEKFNLMSSSFQLIQELENIQIQLKKQFKLFQGKLTSSPEENVEISKKNIKDLHILAKYFRILLSENLDKLRPINPEDPLYRYSNCDIIRARIDNLKSRIIDLTKYYESHASQSSFMSFISGWIPSKGS